MKQWLFLIVLVACVALAINRPVYAKPVRDLPPFFESETDLENVLGWSSGNNVRMLSTDVAHSGKFSSKLQGKSSVSYIFNVLATQLPKQEVQMVRVRAWVYTDADHVRLQIICKAHVAEKEPFIYLTTNVEAEKGKWVQVEHDFPMSWKFNGGDEVSAFVINESDSAVVYVDDMQIFIY